jgi:predicted lipoprotein with Yx(FWY)xxD motif
MIRVSRGLSRYAYVAMGVLTALVLGVWGIKLAVGDSPSTVTRANSASQSQPPAPAPSASADSGYMDGTGPSAAAGADSNANPSPDPNVSMNPAGGGNVPAPVSPSPAAAPRGDRTATLVGYNMPNVGGVVADSGGFTLYRFDKDKAKPATSNCVGACVGKWLPVLAGTGRPALRGIDAKLVGTMRRADGGMQLTLAGWPLYRYTGDTKPGAWKGQGAGGAWWVVTPTGDKNLAGVTQPSSGYTTPPADTGGGNDPHHW